MNIYVSASFKGGTGKTTIATGLYNAFRYLGKNTLFIDLDPNNNATDYFLRSADPEKIAKCNIYHALRGEFDYKSVIYSTDWAQVIPAAPNLSRISVDCASDPGILLRFRAELSKLGFDFVIIDTPPSLGVELRTALYAADIITVPIGFSRWTLQGYDILLSELEKVKSSIGKKPSIYAIPSMVSSTEAMNLREYIDLPYLSTDIIKNNAIKNAATSGQILKEGTIAHSSFAALAQELLHEQG